MVLGVWVYSWTMSSSCFWDHVLFLGRCSLTGGITELYSLTIVMRLGP